MRTVPKIILASAKIIGGGKIDTPNTQIYDHSLFLLATGTPMKRGGVELVLWAHNFPLCEIMRPCKCFPYARKRTTLTYNRANNKHKL